MAETTTLRERLKSRKVLLVCASVVLVALLVMIITIVAATHNNDTGAIVDHAAVLLEPPGPADNYTYVPMAIPKDQLQKLYPPNIRLRSVQVVHRHGERSPTANSIPDLEENQEGWWLCWSPGVSGVFSLREGQTAPFRIVEIGADGAPAPRPPGLCRYGQLTDKGKQALYRLGVYLRNLYVVQLRFLPQTLSSVSTLFLRVTEIPRTHDSALALLLGLYPITHRTRSLPPPPLYATPPGAEYIHPTAACPAQDVLYNRSRAADTTLAEEVAQLRKAFPGVARWMDLCSGVRDGYSPVSAVRDTFVSLVAHGLTLPPDVPPDAIAPLSAVAAHDAYRPYVVDAELSRLTSGRLLGEVLARMEAAVAGAAEPLLALYSAHDSTVGPLTAALGLFDGACPMFASAVTFELLSPLDDAAAFYVRVWYNGRPQPLPFCAAGGAVPFGCPLPDFRQALKPKTLTPAQYEKLCHAE